MPAANRSYIETILAGAAMAANNSITKGTRGRHNLHWTRWTTFLNKAGINNKFLDGYTQYNKSQINSAFIKAVQKQTLDTIPKDGKLAAKTC